MIKNRFKITITSLLLACSIVYVRAASPTISITPTGDGNTVTVNIANADGNSPVVLFYKTTLYTGTQSTTIGNTSSTGVFSGNVSTSAYGITNDTQVYALINGYQTPYITWPYNTSLNTSSYSITFNQTNPTITVGQALSITIHGSSGNYFIYSNTNQTSVRSDISGNTLSVLGLQAGSATITICSNTGTCANQVITVTASSQTTSLLSVTQNTITVTIGQTSQVVVAGGTAPYSTFYDGTNKVTASVSGTVVSITGVSLGNTSVTICGVTGGCAQVSVSIVQNNITTSPVTINVPINVGQSIIMPLSGGNGSYYVATPIVTPFNATISGNNLRILGTAPGSNLVTICSTTTACATINVAVSAATLSTQTPIITTPKYIFENPLYFGMNGHEVLQLQERLAQEGYLYATPNGFFGPATTAAVKAFQRDNGLSQLGNVGPGTRAALNK